MLLLCAFALLVPLAMVAIGVVMKIALIRWKYRHIPSPKTARYSEVGGVFVLYLFMDVTVMVLNPTDIQAVFTYPSIRKYKKPVTDFGYVFGERLVGNGLVVLYDNDLWEKTRPLYDQSFHKDFVQTLLPRFCECTDAFSARLKPLSDGKTGVHMKRQIYVTAMNFISKVVFSLDVPTEWRTVPLDMESVKKLDIYSLWYYAVEGIDIGRSDPLYKYLHWSKTQAYREVAKRLRMIGRECIGQRKKDMEMGIEVPNDILTHTLRLASKEQANDIEHLVDHFTNLHLGGGDPVASMLSFAIILINQHADVLQRLLSEIESVLGKRKEIRIEDLDKLIYTEQVIEETIRLYPTANPFPRECPAGGITLSGYYIPPGTSIATTAAVTNKMPQYFDDPEMFNPSRLNKRPSPFVFFPFGIGPRYCAGKYFALTMTKMLIARLFQEYTITLPDGYWFEVVDRRTHDDIICTILPRK